MHPRFRSIIFVTIIFQLLPGCAGTPKPVFEPPAVPIVWPTAPQTPRIRYIGELHTAEDLKSPKRAGEILSTIFGGRKETQPLYGPRAAICTSDGQRLWVADPGGRCVHIFDLATRDYKKI
ncbi:MAG: hypothetical protein HYR83_14105, partial [Planctomycetes bacterium]|nr:hypothetical protein [Planctomycetota bacterium]